jgi:hypothetical protein
VGNIVQDLIARVVVRDRAAASAELKAAKRDVDDLNESNTKAGTSARKSASDVDRQTKSIASFRSEITKSGNGLKQITLGKSGLFGRLFSVAGVTVVSLLASGVGSLGAASVSTFAALVPMLGALSGIPAAALAGASAFGVFKLATSNLGGALKVLGDRTATAKQIQQALVGLSPQAVSFAGQLNGLRGSYGNQLRNDAQAALLPGLGAGLTTAVPALFPLAQRAVNGIGGALGTGGRIAGQTLASAGVRHDLGTTIDGNNAALATLTKGVGPVIVIIAHLAAALAPVEKMLAADAVHAATFLSLWTGQNTGRITAFFTNGVKDAEQMGKGLWNIGAAIINVFHAATGASNGKTLEQTFLAWSQHLRDITGSAHGQASLESYFSRALPVAHQFVDLLGEIVQDIAKLGANTNLGNLIKTVHDALPGVSLAAQGIVSVVSTLAKIDPNILKTIGAIGAVAYVGNKLNVGGVLGALTGTGKSGSALGGLTGGLLGSAKPIPVFVTNLGAGGLGGVGAGAGAAGAAEGEGKGVIAGAAASAKNGLNRAFGLGAVAALVDPVKGALDKTKFAQQHKTTKSIGNFTAGIGRDAAAGAAAGSVIPIPGISTGVGAVAGTAYGLVSPVAHVLDKTFSSSNPGNYSLKQVLTATQDPGFRMWLGASNGKGGNLFQQLAAYNAAKAIPSTHRTDYADMAMANQVPAYSSLTLADLHGVHDLSGPSGPIPAASRDVLAQAYAGAAGNAGPTFNAPVTFELHDVNDVDTLWGQIQDKTSAKAANH